MGLATIEGLRFDPNRSTIWVVISTTQTDIQTQKKNKLNGHTAVDYKSKSETTLMMNTQIRSRHVL